MPGNTVATILGVQLAQLFHRNIKNRRNLIEINILTYHDRIGNERFLSQYRHNIMLAVICHGIVGRNKSRYIATCLTRQKIVYLPIIGFSTGTTYCLIDIPRATVI